MATRWLPVPPKLVEDRGHLEGRLMVEALRRSGRSIVTMSMR